MTGNSLHFPSKDRVMDGCPPEDLIHVLTHTSGVWERLRGKRLFLTGGTGFIGKWLLESLLWADHELSLGIDISVLTRDEARFRKDFPHITSHPNLRMITGDVRSFAGFEEPPDFIIHGAADASAALNRSDPLLMIDTIVRGTRNVLEASKAHHVPRVLFLSSGAVYGPQPPHITHLSEQYCGGPDVFHPESAYGEAKRMGEMFCSLYYRLWGIETVVARCFAFVGPYLNLDIHFAVGNFIRDGLERRTITVKGDGTPKRSYLYAADLAIWLWVLLVDGEAGTAYNVGSEEVVTIAELAYIVSDCFKGGRKVLILGTPDPTKSAEQYVPLTSKARQHLNLVQHIGTREAIQKTIEWHRATARRLS
ncbi:MAG: dTDP-glucose 4,6-dehydratase [Syntrophorhabdus sp. PtaU1.Bin153]|nr:MAG: dTDP-glucose 4,6-dehydratase [Syntrophorhabdus sp. PtaU1.Bin153]